MTINTSEPLRKQIREAWIQVAEAVAKTGKPVDLDSLPEYQHLEGIILWYLSFSPKNTSINIDQLNDTAIYFTVIFDYFKLDQQVVDNLRIVQQKLNTITTK